MIRRGDVYYADLSPVVGSEQGGVRPVVVVQNDKGNRYSKQLLLLYFKKMSKPPIPTHVIFSDDSLSYVSDPLWQSAYHEEEEIGAVDLYIG